MIAILIGIVLVIASYYFYKENRRFDRGDMLPKAVTALGASIVFLAFSILRYVGALDLIIESLR